jgi:ADP-heptose:LPS heptosyltransferase
MSRLVVFAPNWLGDAVLALPALADVVRASPAGAVDVAATKAIAPLYSLVPGLRDRRFAKRLERYARRCRRK